MKFYKTLSAFEMPKTGIYIAKLAFICQKSGV